MRLSKLTGFELAEFIRHTRIVDSPPALVRFGFAAGCVLGAFALRYALSPQLGARMPFAFFIPAALIAAWYGGVGAGLFALTLGLILGDYFFLPPTHAFGLISSLDLAIVITYACSVLIGVGVIENLHRTKQRAETISRNAEQLRKEMLERARAEESLRQSEERFRLLMDEAKDYALLMVDVDGKVLNWNAGAQRIQGYGAEDIVGQPFAKFYVPEDVEAQKPSLDLQKAASEGRCEDESWRIRKDGSRYWASVVITALHDKEGQLVCFSKLVRDVTEKKRIQEELKDREERLRELADAMPQIVWATLPGGRVEYVNRKWFEYTGITPEQTYTSKGWVDIVHPDDRERVIQSIQGAAQTGNAFQMESRIRSQTGDYRWHLTRGLPVKDDTGKVVRWFATSTDIEEQKRTEQDLEKVREQLAHHARDLETSVVERTARLEESIRSLEGVLYHVAHDLRAPLRAMEGFTQLLLEMHGEKFDGVEKDCAWRIIAAANRMDQLIKDLLAYGKLTHMDIPCRRINLEAEIDRVLVALESEIKSRKAKVTVERPVPRVWANPMVMNQILAHLLFNALKFVRPDTMPEVRVLAAELNKKVRLWVCDNGIGIDESYQDQIFRVFERLHEGEGYYLGTGIGLAIVRTGTERMGGTVGVESKPGQGSRFWVELPVGPTNQ